MGPNGSRAKLGQWAQRVPGPTGPMGPTGPGPNWANGPNGSWAQLGQWAQMGPGTKLWKPFRGDFLGQDYST